MNSILILCLVGLTIGAVVVAVASRAKRPKEPVYGEASYYGEAYRGKRMANGQRFDPNALTCAAWDWPLGTVLRVSRGGNSVLVTVTDRGPAIRLNRVVDLSQAAFARLAPLTKGLIYVNVEEVR